MASNSESDGRSSYSKPPCECGGTEHSERYHDAILHYSDIVDFGRDVGPELKDYDDWETFYCWYCASECFSTSDMSHRSPERRVCGPCYYDNLLLADLIIERREVLRLSSAYGVPERHVTRKLHRSLYELSGLRDELERDGRYSRRDEADDDSSDEVSNPNTRK